MNINNNHFSSIRQVQETYFQNQPGISRKNSETAASFQEILKQKSEADEKGIRESLVIMDNLSFIVNIKNRTVITAMDQSENEENVYTNIDGAVII